MEQRQNESLQLQRPWAWILPKQEWTSRLVQIFDEYILSARVRLSDMNCNDTRKTSNRTSNYSSVIVQRQNTAVDENVSIS